MFQIVLVDDEENVLHSLKRLLHKEKEWFIHAFSDAAEALEFIRDNEIDVVVSDYKMPGMNGVQFLSAVREANPDTMRLILSGYTDVVALMDAINTAEIYRYICKPVDEYEFTMTIKRAINHLELMRENKRLADIVRRQHRELNRHKAAIDRILEENPEIGIVNRDADGAIVIDIDVDDDIDLDDFEL